MKRKICLPAVIRGIEGKGGIKPLLVEGLHQFFWAQRRPDQGVYCNLVLDCAEAALQKSLGLGDVLCGLFRQA